MTYFLMASSSTKLSTLRRNSSEIIGGVLWGGANNGCSHPFTLDGFDESFEISVA